MKFSSRKRSPPNMLNSRCTRLKYLTKCTRDRNLVVALGIDSQKQLYENLQTTSWWNIGMDEHLAEVLQLLLSSNLFHQKRHLHHIELIVELLDLL